MKSIILITLSILLLLGPAGGCGNKKTPPVSMAIKDIAFLTLDGDLPEQTTEQLRELKITMEWMDDNLIKIFRKSAFQPQVIKEMSAYKPEMGKLLIIKVERFNAGSRAARAFVGFGAGSASLDLHYKLLDEKGALLSEWRDGVGSSKGATYCAETLNRRALEKALELLNN
jgi:hypothetical protein